MGDSEIFRLTQKACTWEYFGKISREAMHLSWQLCAVRSCMFNFIRF
jgi:hypothetical protein